MLDATMPGSDRFIAHSGSGSLILGLGGCRVESQLAEGNVVSILEKESLE